MRPQHLSVAALLAVLVLSGCAEQWIQRQAREQAANGQLPQAVALLEEGVRRHPESAPLRSNLLQLKAEQLQSHLTAAAAARDAGRLDDAQARLQQAQAIEPRNARVEALLADLRIQRQQQAALGEAAERLAHRQPEAAVRMIEQALKDNPRHAALLALKRQAEAELRQRTAAGSGGQLAEQRPITLDFREAPLRMVLDMVSRHSGINFVLDRDIRADLRVTVLMRQARVEDALDMLASTNQLARKVVDATTVLIYPNTPEKQREYQEQVVRVFHLASAEAKGAAAFLRSMLKIREPFVDERSNLLALRDTPENIQLAERLVALFDAGEPEVLLEVEVLEVSATRLTELGIKFPDSFSLTPLGPAGLSGGLTLGNAGDIDRNRIGLGVGGVLVNLKREVGDFSTLAHPSIRARNREKAKILIGDKIPIITTTAATGGFVSESVNYLEVGLKLDVEPTVYADDEVAIRIALEVSSLGTAVKSSNGTLAYQIGTRNAATLLRLRDGETQVLAGLISKDERTSASRVPGIGDLPVLGRLFANQQDQGSRSELLLAITPRILRNIRRPDASESELWVGTDAMPRLRPPRAALAGGVPPTTPPPPATPATQGPSAAAALAGQPEAPPAQPGTPAAPPKALQLIWQGPAEVQRGDTFDLHLLQPGGVALRGMPVDLAIDRQRLQLLDVVEGDAFRRDGAATAFQQTADPATGRLRISTLRKEATTVAEPGRLFTLRLKALSAGPALLRVDNALPIALPGPAPAVGPAEWTVTVR